MTRISDREYTDNPDHDRLLWTVFYEETSPLEMVRDVELGIRVSETIDGLEGTHEITFWCERAELTALNKILAVPRKDR